MEKDSKNYDVISISFLNIILRYLTFFLKQKIHTVIYIYIRKITSPIEFQCLYTRAGNKKSRVSVSNSFFHSHATNSCTNHIILCIIKIGVRCHGYATWFHQIAEILLNFYIFKELKKNSILPGF